MLHLLVSFLYASVLFWFLLGSQKRVLGRAHVPWRCGSAGPSASGLGASQPMALQRNRNFASRRKVVETALVARWDRSSRDNFARQG